MDLLILTVLGVLIWFWLKRRKKKDKWDGFEAAKRRLAPQQAAYEKMLFGLPELTGDGSFSQEVVGEQAYKEALDLFGEFIQRYHPGQDEIWVLVELEPTNKFDKNAVRVEAGQTTVGYIPRTEAVAFGRELRELGGKARCNARFHWSPADGKSSLSLDVIRPLQAK